MILLATLVYSAHRSEAHADPLVTPLHIPPVVLPVAAGLLKIGDKVL
jgi:hypothetical protein